MFMNKNLCLLGYWKGFTQWLYTTQDTMAIVEQDGYFDTVYTIAATGDIIIIVAADGTGQRFMKLHDDRTITLTKLI